MYFCVPIVYVDIGAVASDTATLAFNFAGTSNNRNFEIKVTQVPCGANYRWGVFLAKTLSYFHI